MYTLYGYPNTRSLRVAWTLEELNIPYEYQLVDLRRGAHLSDDFAALSPTAKVPLLKTPEGLLSESAAIVTYLADKHGAGTLIPESGSFARGHFSQMLFFLVAELEQPLWNKAKHTFILPEQYRLKDMADCAKFEFEKALKAFCSLLENNEYIAGDYFTVADIVAGHILSWAKSEGMNLTYDHVQSYAKRVVKRPAYSRAWERENTYLAG
ncbi:glutathione S-transferase family protein [Alteromonas sp. ASW11-130]|uniref:glutathione S-transferase family protein n=1 Tax=Alteromonas sp. ASW11-130 TaxID=3015775 RepID=UPI002241EEB9|nr:glutathione S-transferase family protein [Alteromonas sp. ASW11-130]MCW8091770.1 glutathione S-transferase family protein [Alteromonas sp. ASW11-130]